VIGSAAARNRGGLQTNAFVRLRKLFSDGRQALQIDELGDADSILHNKLHLRETAQRLIQRGMIPKDDGWSGWLGRYQKALRQAAGTIERQQLRKQSERDKDRDRRRVR
jgi:hypothetical protein